ncbi:efflux transporter outer membrane subunit [Geoalkalibacter sp.]|uniref:efflux transporter outer membrane subunit n=1 Tax=Geoalkalibacter sp. TaxID=3041440 RepID=UPI00272EC07B|nr:efflux transporter outer membrane subunit [Geoalkalibacter sp.]
MNPRRCLFVVLLILTGGCALRQPQPITLPIDEVPATYGGISGQEQVEPPHAPWWRAFADPALDALLNQALVANPDWRQALARLEQAEALQRAARAPLLPSLDLQGQGRREKSPGIFGEHTGTSYSLSLAAGYEIDLWQKIAGRARAADLDLQAATGDAQALLLTLSARVADFYYLAAEQRSQLELIDASIATFADTLERVELRYREGLVPALDVHQARLALDAARARRPQYESGRAQAEHALAVLLGRYPGDLPTGALIPLPEVPRAFPAGLPSTLLARRPDVQAALLRVQAADARLGAAVAERFPALNLLAGYGYAENSFALGDISGTFWNLILNAAQPLFDGGRRRAEVERHEALVRERLAAYHGTVLGAFQEVEDALAANRANEERIARLETQTATTAATLRLSLEQYLAGLSDYLPVLSAQSNHFNSQSQLVSARRQLISDRITLARALGGRWMAAELDLQLSATDQRGDQLP